MKLFTFIMLMLASILAKADCNINIPNMNFGQYEPFNLQPNFTSINIVVNCTQLATYTINGTTGNSNNYNDRQMQETTGKSVLHYNLYKDSATTIVFGNNTQNSAGIVNSGTSTPIYAKILPQQNVVAGNYNDNIQIEVVF